MASQRDTSRLYQCLEFPSEGRVFPVQIRYFVLCQSIQLRVNIDLAALVVVAFLPKHESCCCERNSNRCGHVEPVSNATIQIEHCPISHSTRETSRLSGGYLPILWSISLNIRPGAHNTSNRSNHYIRGDAGRACSVADGIDSHLCVCQSAIREDT